MSLTEGGEWKCLEHCDLETKDYKVWNQHCIEAGITEEGSHLCDYCKTVWFNFKGYPFRPFLENGHRVPMVMACKDCQAKLNAIEVNQI